MTYLELILYLQAEMAALAQPEQEPVAWQIINAEGTARFTDNSNAMQEHTRNGKEIIPLYTAPPAAQWDKPAASFNDWWDSYHIDPANPFAEGSAAYWAWAGWKAAQRPWVGLTDEERKDALVSVDAETKRLPPGMTAFARAIEAKLKERNNGP
jgi:hypothetical protein